MSIEYSPYYPDGWDDSPSTSTPIVAEALDTIDQGIEAADAAINAEVSRAESAEALKAPLEDAALTGTPTAPTAAAGTNTAQIATTAFVQAALPTSLPPEGDASGDLSGSYPGPSVVKVNGASVPVSKTIVGTNADGQITDASTATLANDTTGNAATATNLAGGATFPAYVAPAVKTLTDDTTVAVDAALGNDFRWAIGADGNELGEPSNPVNGQVITIAIKYGGAYTPAFNAVYDFGSAGAPAWSAASGKTDYCAFRYDSDLNGGAGEWAYQGSVLGLTS